MASLFSFLYQLLFSVALPLIAFLLYEYLARRNAAVKHDASDAATAAFASQVQEELTQLQKQKEATPATTVNTAAAATTVTAEVVTASPSASAASAAPAAVAAPKPKEKEEDTPQSTSCPAPATDKPLPAAILIAYASQSQNSLALAHKLFSLLSAHVHTTFNSNNSDGSSSSSAICPEVRVLEMREEEDEANNSAEAAAPNRVKVSNVCRVDTLLDANQYALTIFITSTYTDGMAPPRSQAFEAILKDAFEDHRIPRNTLAKKRFAVFGLGDIAYGEERFNTFAKHLHEWCRGLGAPAFVVPPVYATENKTQSLFKVFSTALLKWVSRATFHADGTLTVKKKTDVAAGAGRSGAASTASSSSVTARARRLKNTSAATPAAAAAEGCACCQSDGGDGGGGSAGPCCRDTQGEGVAFQEQDNYDDDDDEGSSNGGQDAGEEDMDDVEDLVWDGTDDANFDATADPSELPELLYPKLRQNLEKQGYRLIGSHSGVKLCRWTKSMLRGRGGCYKHTFYNINSSQCMEMTPSLACANKCVFCWRHHTNPISRHFRWKQDPPELLIAQGMAGHYQMIKQMRGVPGVTPERLATAMQIRHCALSLVGEPIMYPQINGFCDLLHENHISSFMVTNAQFPEQLRDLKPVVQLYLSIDAPTPDELKRIDRPLFEDYWERCVSCVKELAKKPQRTVFRLTLVNMYNTENVKAYADLVDMGQPDFIEVKGVTYCGTSTSSTLTMKDNVPRHDEVIGFCKALCEEMALRNPQYKTPQMYDDVKGRPAAAKNRMKNPADDFMMNDSGDDKETGEEEEAAAMDDSDVIVVPPEERDRPYHIACEHEHSCCVLIALDKFFYEGHWHTWIDYEKFYELVESGRSDFTSLDYAAPTPTWATYKSKERGFDPEQTRVTGKKARPTANVSVGA